LSGINGGRGRHAASHAKPGKLAVTKTKVTTTAAVTGAFAFAGGVAEAVHVRSGQLRQQQAAQADAAPATTAARGLATANDQIISQLLQQRGAAAGAVNRDLNRGLSNVVGGAAVTTGATTPPLTIATSPTPTSLAPLTTPGSAAALAGVTPSSGVPTTQDPSSSPTSTTDPTATPTPTDPSSPTTPLPSASATTAAKPAPKPTTTAVSHPAGWDASPAQARALAQSMVPASQWACFDNVITRESSWNVHAVNPSSGAYGLPQALPGDKMAEVSADWRDNAVTQIKWAINYMDGRYGSPCAAWSFWQAHNWY
jgi:hypothetical protein